MAPSHPSPSAGSDQQASASVSRARSDPSAMLPRDARSSHLHPSDDLHHPAVESWIEVSSNPSSSSVSSIGDDIVTTGLRVGSSYPPRRRRLHPHSQPQFRLSPAHLRNQQRPHDQPQPASAAAQFQAGASSQEEYEESDSDDDHRLLTSSGENMASARRAANTPLRQVVHVQPPDSDISEEDDDDDHGTALGSRRPSAPFRPQPNAFTHPPSHLQHRHSTSSSTPHQHVRPSFRERSHTRIDHPPHFMSPNYQAENEAALRASLTTLLSCAAAARSRPREGSEKDKLERNTPSNGSQPVELRLVPESDLMSPPADSPPIPATTGPSSHPSPPSGPSRQATGERVKRSTTPPVGPSSKSQRATKKKTVARVSSEEAGAVTPLISPTLLTWVVGAGVVVLVSVVGFGAGYVIGREVGRQESLASLGSGGANASALADGSSCGQEVVRSSGGTLRRFRWGAGVRSVTA